MKNALTLLGCVILSGCNTTTAPKQYSQATPLDTLSSLIVASENRDIDYLKMHASYSRKMFKLIDNPEEYRDYDDIQVRGLIQSISYSKNNGIDVQNKSDELVINGLIKRKAELEKLRHGTLSDCPIEIGKSSVIPAVNISNTNETETALGFFKINNKWYFLICWVECNT